MRRRIVAGNWKMNGSRALVQQLLPPVSSELASLDNGVGVVVIPPALYVASVLEKAGAGLEVGVQNIACQDAGAFTGEISASMASDTGCRYALVGHSERRQLFGETDDQIAAKVSQAVSHGLTAILCVGETLAQREAGAAEHVVAGQVQAGLAKVAAGQWQNIVVAYEPVWAIGTGKTATAGDAQAMHAAIRQELKKLGAPADELSLLYGGSVKADNAAALFAQPDIDGGLIGGASLKADEFLSICRAMPGEC
ncbi:triose-phosphate isomerase [Marinobacter confluentis]|uniref:Triosephosphate isomerase n=1 Tax=Marinobacter confluentis TaxID=1697557 RepID=A0A4Z1BS73_9GAMM|nr:triose-phosphate isomerase [Marinobacter confluentis]TGN40545.1 triose-phosphate isomerase [Marinobacter confluentis]